MDRDAFAAVESLAEEWRAQAADHYERTGSPLMVNLGAYASRLRAAVTPERTPSARPECTWARCTSPRLGKCVAWCKCQCHRVTSEQGPGGSS
jgi:hypothetical protein